MQLQQCRLHRNTIVNFTIFTCPLCALIKAVKEVSVDAKKDQLVIEEAKKQIFNDACEDCGEDLEQHVN